MIASSTRVGWLLVLLIGFGRWSPAQAIEETASMQGEFWRTQALEQLMPLWYRHVRDLERGAFYTNLSRDWRPQPPWDKFPAMIGRQVFSFSAVYLLSGEDRFLEVARDGVEYLLAHAWDQRYGGWYDRLAADGSPAATTKTVAYQLYTDVGLTLYYFTTGDQEVLSHLRRSLQLRCARARDDRFGGYYQALDRDLSVVDDGKNKHAHYGYVGSLLLNLYLATRDPQILAYERELADLSLARMLDPVEGWVYGFGGTFDRQWRRTPRVVDGVEYASSGAQLTAALAFLRLYHQSGEPRYLEEGRRLGDRVTRWAWEPARGAWLDPVAVRPPHAPPATAVVSWWIQIYGAFLQLQLYHLTGEQAYLDCFRKSEEFFLAHMIDREFGGVFAAVNPSGELADEGMKAAPWHTSYHEIEHALLNYLYLNLYVNHEPAVLHFRLDGGREGREHYVSLVDDPKVQVAGVRLNGVPWPTFDPARRSVSLPAGQELRLEVTLAPAP